MSLLHLVPSHITLLLLLPLADHSINHAVSCQHIVILVVILVVIILFVLRVKPLS